MSAKLRDDYVIKFTDGSPDRLGVNLHIALGVIATHLKRSRRELSAEPVGEKPIDCWVINSCGGTVVATVQKEKYDASRHISKSPAFLNAPKFTSRLPETL